MVERRVDVVELLEQFTLEQDESVGIGGRRIEDLVHVDPDQARPEHDVVPCDVEDLAPDRLQRFQQPVQLLPQGRPGLFFVAAGPEQVSQAAAQDGPRCGQRHNGEHRTGLAPDRQHALTVGSPGFHVPDQSQTADRIAIEHVARHLRHHILSTCDLSSSIAAPFARLAGHLPTQFIK